jgi:hypothetical protein
MIMSGALKALSMVIYSTWLLAQLPVCNKRLRGAIVHGSMHFCDELLIVVAYSRLQET